MDWSTADNGGVLPNSKMMKRIVSIIFLLAVGSAGLRAQDVDIEQIREDIISNAGRVLSIDCDFTQIKESSLLSDKAVSTGHLTYRKPDYLEWSYKTPFVLTLTVDGAVTRLNRDGHKEELSGKQARMIGELTKLIVSNVNGSILTDNKMFSSSLSVADGQIVITLSPRNKEMKKMWKALVLYYDMDCRHARRFDMLEQYGDLTSITFNNAEYEFSE